jgi:hypothetical protein
MIFLKFCLADLSIAERKLTIAFNDIIAWTIGLIFGNVSIQLFEKFRKIGFIFSLRQLNPSRPTPGQQLISNIQGLNELVEPWQKMCYLPTGCWG